MWKKFNAVAEPEAQPERKVVAPATLGGSTVRDERVFKEAVRFVYEKREPSPCPCKSQECSSDYSKVMDYIATIKTECPMPKNLIVGVSGMGHLSAEAHVKTERKDETDLFNYIRTMVVNTIGQR